MIFLGLSPAHAGLLSAVVQQHADGRRYPPGTVWFPPMLVADIREYGLRNQINTFVNILYDLKCRLFSRAAQVT